VFASSSPCLHAHPTRCHSKMQNGRRMPVWTLSDGSLLSADADSLSQSIFRIRQKRCTVLFVRIVTNSSHIAKAYAAIAATHRQNSNAFSMHVCPQEGRTPYVDRCQTLSCFQLSEFGLCNGPIGEKLVQYCIWMPQNDSVHSHDVETVNFNPTCVLQTNSHEQFR
jgi:hypothetical protein